MSDDRRRERPQDEWQREFASSLRKATEQLALGAAHEASHWAHKWAEDARKRTYDRIEHKRQRQMERAQRHAARKVAKREAKLAASSPFEGKTYFILAIVLLAMAVTMPHLWWLVFIAIAFAANGAQIIGFHRAREPQPLPEQKAPPAKQTQEPRDGRIDEVCDKLKAALKDAPQVVHDFLSKPDETVEALRKTSQDLFKREMALRGLVTDAETERLTRERAGLQARIERETDEVVRTRLNGALAALDHQRTQHAEVLKSANRLEAERTRLGYTLEGLYAQVMRLKTADAGSADLVNAGLRTSLDQLRDEMNALAQAVEQVNQAPAFEPPQTFDDAGTAARDRVH